MRDQRLNDTIIAYIEKDIFNGIDNEISMQSFQTVKQCRGQL